MSAALILPGDAAISPCGLYRYRLTRRWSSAPALPFVMLNPSTADASLDDPTIRRCIGFARREGAGGIIVCNRYAFRATSPSDMLRARDPFGPENEAALTALSFEAAASGMPIVCAWGAAGDNSNRHVVVLQRGSARLACLGRTKDGSPRHPLYVRSDAPLVDLFAGGGFLMRAGSLRFRALPVAGGWPGIFVAHNLPRVTLPPARGLPWSRTMTVCALPGCDRVVPTGRKYCGAPHASEARRAPTRFCGACSKPLLPGQAVACSYRCSGILSSATWAVSGRDEAVRAMWAAGISNAEIARRMVPPGDKNAVQRIRKRLGLPPRARSVPVARDAKVPAPRAQRSPTGPTLSLAGLSPTRRTPVPTTLPPVLTRSYVHPKLGAWTYGCPCCARAILGPLLVAA